MKSSSLLLLCKFVFQQNFSELILQNLSVLITFKYWMFILQ